MKKVMLMAVLALGLGVSAMAQEVGSYQLSTGDLYQGMSRTIPNGRVVVPYGLEVTFDKTVHLIFPAPIRYVDLGSNALVAGKADEGGGAENVLRVKAAVRDFERESNLSVICDDGSFYSFNVKYAEEPEKLTVEMQDFLAPLGGRLPSNRADIYFRELGNESPVLVKLIMQTIYQNNKREVKHIGAKQFGLRFQLRGLYAHNGLLYFHTRIDNESNMPFSVDFISFRVVDKKVAKQTAIQERVLQPLRAYHQVMQVRPNGRERTVFALEQFALTEDKQLEVTLYELNGGRTLTFYMQNEDLLRARRMDNLKLKW
ncbi:conjugative transposon protein TraN [Porphyromonas levii]|uniref:conjugative transposon protein TraN n=1 Tax=Porphyromonas levii TaxID=28114 RepID=UPI001B8ADF7B|nr:conjugative transposon protein TraN [Porphyromonas levii]